MTGVFGNSWKHSGREERWRRFLFFVEKFFFSLLPIANKTDWITKWFLILFLVRSDTGVYEARKSVIKLAWNWFTAVSPLSCFFFFFFATNSVFETMMVLDAQVRFYSSKIILFRTHLTVSITVALSIVFNAIIRYTRHTV